MAKSRTTSSQRWLQRQRKDSYVKRAAAEGYRSRAAYKLLEINERDSILRPGMVVVDLGAAPGGWSQVASEIVGAQGYVIALDLLPIDPMPMVDIIEGDFTDFAIVDAVVKKLADQNRRVDLVISDMAPNISGISDIDVPRALYLAEVALQFAKTTLRKDGTFLVKLFQGQGFTQYVQELRQDFGKVSTRKPKASRSESREVYLLAQNFRGGS